MGAIAQSSGLLDLATATSTADTLNSSRKDRNAYFRVFRLDYFPAQNVFWGEVGR
jgi:hypothetical protein